MSNRIQNTQNKPTLPLSIVTTAVVMAFASVGCGDAANKAAELAGIGSADLQHRFQQEKCSESLALKIIGGSKRTTLEFSGDSVARNEQFFSEGDCKEAVAVDVIYRGRFEKKDEIQEDVHQLNLSYGQVVVIPRTEAGVNALNTINLCGTSDWAIGREVDVTAVSRGATCPVDGTPQNIFDIYTIQDDVLFLGKGDAASKATPETRATELDREQGYRKAD
jgi:hypothetical protein